LETAVKYFLAAVLSSLALVAADKQVTYTCPSGESFQVMYQKKGTRAVLVVAGKPKLTLAQSGAQYSDGFTVLTVQGAEATLASGAVNSKGCTDSTVKNTPPASLAGKWTIATLAGQAVALPRAPFIEFQADGSAAGLAGCNRFNSGFVSSGTSLSFKAVAVTRMACIGDAMNIENRFLQAMEQTTAYSISAKTLTLRNAAGQSLATLTKD
jgi:heat shock protein HslJ